MYSRLSAEFDELEFVALTADKAMFDFIHERLNDPDAQAASPSSCDPVIEFTEGFGFGNCKVDAGVVLDDDLEAVSEADGDNINVELRVGRGGRLGRVRMLDDVGASLANSHLDFHHVLVAQTRALRAGFDHLTNGGQGIRRTRRTQMIVPQRG